MTRIVVVAVAAFSLLVACDEKKSEATAPAGTSAAAAAKPSEPAAAAAPAAAPAAAGLVGKWGLEGEAIWEFRADGTGTILDPDDPGHFKYVVEGDTIHITPQDGEDEPEDVKFKLVSANKLSLDMGDEPDDKMDLDRVADTAKAGSAHHKK